MPTLFVHRGLSALAAVVCLAGCEAAKSANPTAASVAGPIAGVNITAPKPLEPYANSTLTFDYEILAVKPLSFLKLMRDGIAAGTVEEAIAKARALPNLKSYYVSVQSIQSVATAANRKEAGSNEKVLELGITLLPDAYQLHQSLGRLQATRGDKPAAIKSYELALKLNPKKTPTEIRDHEATTAALRAELAKTYELRDAELNESTLRLAEQTKAEYRPRV